MRAFAILVFVLGIGSAGGAVFFMYQEYQAVAGRLATIDKNRRGVPTVEVVVATEGMKYGQTLTEDLVRVVKWPAASAPENTFAAIDEVFQEDVQRTVLRRMEPGEAVLRSKVTGFGETATVAALLTPGMRAFTLPVNASTSGGGHLLPGTRIDVLVTTNDREPATYYVAQDVQVIAVDQDADPDRVKAHVARTITIEVTPEEVQQLVAVRSFGSIAVAMRGFGSNEYVASRAIDRSDLFGPEIVEEEEEVIVEEVAEVTTVKVRRAGGEVTSVEISDR